ncbi:glycosyltransferase family 4 protein [Actinomadura barringtoniae]|uniref:Glycosyltransferase family 4 protein n=1 Tax=Actinomadura barringtoniae TaxID=1427535 RepID=A0A939PP79_9ACTN|nr:glycosyltransferase family 4 protein [Actinomadura barringtoniae]MBO2452191.1 glycosyltransferase family 4 protein [Actinomadura barringtoniae]
MKITYVLLHAYGMGGTIRTVINQANAMAEAGHQVELVSATRRAAAPNFFVDPRVRLTTLTDQRTPAPAAPGIEIPYGEAAKDTFTSAVERGVINYLRTVETEILVTTRPGLNLLSARYTPAHIVRVAQDHMHLGRYKPAVRAAILRDYPRLDAVVSLTRKDQYEYRQALGDDGGVRVEQIPNPLHTLDVPQTDHTGKVVAAAGRLTRQKGFDLLILAFAKVVDRHPDWRLHIYGSGKAEPKLRKLIHAHHLYNHVFLMGRTKELDEELAKASIYALSSRFEGFPMTLLEALNCGLPVATFDCPTGPSEIIVDEASGLLVPPEDTAELAAAVCRLIEDEPLRRQLGAAARTTATAYGSDAIRLRWETLFTSLLTAKTEASG